MKLIRKYDEYLDWRRGKQNVGFFVENNRMYPNYEERKQMCRRNADYVVYSYTPNYERLVGIDPELAKELFKASRDSVDEVMLRRDFTGVDVVLIPDEGEQLPHYDTRFKQCVSYIKGVELPYDLLENQCIRALYGTAYYFCHEPDYIALCPYAYLYNVYTKRMLTLHGVRSEYINGITEGGILNGHKIFSV